MSELTIPERVAAEAGEDDLVHVVCCDENLAQCGKDVTDKPMLPSETETTCAVCAIAEAEELPCAASDCPYREGAVS